MSPLEATATPVGEDVEPGLAGALARLAGLQVHAAVGTELCHLHAFHALVAASATQRLPSLSMAAWCGSTKRPAPNFFGVFAVRSKFDHRNAVVRFTTVHGPEVIVRMIDRNGIARTPGPRRRRPIHDLPAGIAEVVVRF